MGSRRKTGFSGGATGCLCLLLSFVLPCWGQRTYTITDIGTLGGNASGGDSINNNGEVTGFSYDALGRQHAIVYRPGQGLFSISGGSPNRTLGTRINARGQVSVTEFTPSDPNPLAGLLFSPPSQFTRLQLSGATHGEARGINNSGQVAGVGLTPYVVPFQAFLYTPGVGVVALDPLSESSYAHDVNNFGVVSGNIRVGGNAPAVIYTPGSGRTNLGTLGGWFANGFAINDLGQVAGDSYTPANASHAFLYTPGSGMRDLGVLPGTETSLALDINNHSEVVGLSGGRPFFHSHATGMIDVNTLLPAGSGWRLTGARGINELGQITGEGIIGGQSRGYILTPAPAPLPSGPSRFVPVQPCRAVDTRLTGIPVAGESIRRFSVSGGGCNVPAGATAFSLNVTVVPRQSLSYLTIWPAGGPLPNVSTINSFDGRIKANAAIVPAGVGGAVDIYASDTTNIILDVNGYFESQPSPNALSFYPLTPCRVADTRGASEPPGFGRLTGGQTRTLPVLATNCGIPASARAYSLNLTVIPPGPLAFLTTWPAGSPQPTVSTLNAFTGAVTANAAIVPAGTNGSINLFATDNTDLAVDVNGYFAPPGAPGGLSFYVVRPCRAFDTRTGTSSLAAGESREFPIRSSPCGLPANAAGYSLNATVVPRATLAYLTLSPFGTQPLASTLNAFDGVVASNASIVPAGTNGSVAAFVTNATDLILDVNGYFAP